jgi:asparagine synthase (glutamine-hydrolysing)
LGFRILAVQRDQLWSLLSDNSEDLAATSGYTVALAGFVSNLGDLEQRYARGQDCGLSPIERLSRLLDHGPDKILDQLKGNFAVLVVRPDTGQLWARRDRLGAHSLYLARLPRSKGWAVGNSAADVFRASGHGFEEDPEYLAGFFSMSGQKREGRSPFKGVQALLAGEVLVIDGQRVQTRRSPVAMGDRPGWTCEAEAVETFRHLLQASVANCLASTADSAVMLSGGLDSGPVAIIGDGICQSRGQALVPISWSLHDFPEADETPWIDQLAQDLSTPLVRLESSSLLPFSDLESSPVNPETPSFNAFRPLINRCYRTAAAMGCTVILNGNAGDELYAPFHLLYRGYLANREWRYLFDDLAGTYQRGGWRAIGSKSPLHSLLKQPFRRFRRRTAPAWLTRQARNHWAALDTWPPECQQHWLPEYAEQLYGRSMASGRAQEYFQSCDLGVERRDPFQNEELVAFMLQAPFSFSFRHHRSKWIMREAMRGMLPERIRLKRRTGLMGDFYLAGKRANRMAIATFLFEQHREWQRWVQVDAVREALDNDQGAGPAGLLVDQCIGYVNWLRYWQSS